MKWERPHKKKTLPKVSWELNVFSSFKRGCKQLPIVTISLSLETKAEQKENQKLEAKEERSN